jgi:hypothetical protein
VVAIRVVLPDDWAAWRAIRLEALADAPGAFSSARSDWEFADEQRWRQRLEEVPFNAIAVLDHTDVGQVSGTDLGDDRCVELRW